MSAASEDALTWLGALLLVGGLVAGGAFAWDHHIEPVEAGFSAFALILGAGLMSPKRIGEIAGKVGAPLIAAWKGRAP